jgi:hypothetical protein
MSYLILVSATRQTPQASARILILRGDSFLGESWVDKQSTVPTVICPGCLKPMRLTMLEPALSQRLETATFHCNQCGADTKRVVRREK